MSCCIALWSYYIVFQLTALNYYIRYLKFRWILEHYTHSVLEVGPITFLQLKTWCLQQWPVEIQLLSSCLLSSSFFFSYVGIVARPANLWRYYLLCLWNLLWRSTNNLLPLGSNQILGITDREFTRSGLGLRGFSQQ